MVDNEYFSKVFDKIEATDFETYEDQIIIKQITDAYDEYKRPPTILELETLLGASSKITNKEKKTIEKRLEVINNVEVENVHKDILIDATENYIRNIRTVNALKIGIDIVDGGNNLTLEEWQEQIKEIVQLSFKSSLGHDYVQDAEKRFLEYSKMEEERISSGISLLDQAGYGLKKKLSIVSGQSNVGKCWQYDTKFKIYVSKELKHEIMKFLKRKRVI